MLSNTLLLDFSENRTNLRNTFRIKSESGVSFAIASQPFGRRGLSLYSPRNIFAREKKDLLIVGHQIPPVTLHDEWCGVLSARFLLSTKCPTYVYLHKYNRCQEGLEDLVYKSNMYHIMSKIQRGEIRPSLCAVFS